MSEISRLKENTYCLELACFSTSDLPVRIMMCCPATLQATSAQSCTRVWRESRKVTIYPDEWLEMERYQDHRETWEKNHIFPLSCQPTPSRYPLSPCFRRSWSANRGVSPQFLLSSLSAAWHLQDKHGLTKHWQVQWAVLLPGTVLPMPGQSAIDAGGIPASWAQEQMEPSFVTRDWFLHADFSLLSGDRKRRGNLHNCHKRGEAQR